MDGRFWAGPDRVKVDAGELRLLSAWEVLEARREGDALAQDGRERALCRNACLVARALERKGKPVFGDGQAALTALRVEEIAALMGCGAPQVSTYLYRGRQKLKTMLGGIYGQQCLSE